MTFKEVLAQAIDWLQQDKRLSYRALQRQFDLDNDYLDDLKAELIEVRRVAVDEDGRSLVWTGDTPSVSATLAVSTVPRAQGPLTYTSSHLAEKILTSRSALKGERKQVTVLFADLELIYAKQLAAGAASRVLIWTGGTAATPRRAPPPGEREKRIPREECQEANVPVKRE